MRISRREFACGIAGIAVAAAAAQLPIIMERRVYSPGSALPPAEILHRYGIRPASVEPTQGGTAYRIPFASLEARVNAWDGFNTDEDWCAIRDAGNVALQEIRVYPPVYPGGKIFEMSL
jgi:hypothetical protein